VLDAEGNVLGVTEADLLLKQERPDLEFNVPWPGTGGWLSCRA
jgi:hypothetical protein